MKKTTSLIGLLCTACFMATPAFAMRHVENLACEGPSKIYFAKKDFERKYASSDKAYKNPCKARYDVTAMSSSDGHANDWAPYSSFYSQLIMEPQNTVIKTLHPFIPQNARLDGFDQKNPNDIVLAYRVIQKEDRRDLLRYIIFRALKQSDGSVRIYQFEMDMQADTHYLDSDHRGYSEWKPYNKSIPQRAYDHFNQVVTHNRTQWLQYMKELHTLE